MNPPHLPWLEIAILAPLIGALCVAQLRDAERARRWAVIFSGIALVSTIEVWRQFFLSKGTLDSTALAAGQSALWLSRVFGRNVFVIDELSVPLLPLTSLLYFLTTLATLRTKVRRVSFPLNLTSLGLALATFSCVLPWGVVVLLALGTIPPFLELRLRARPTTVYVVHMAGYIVCLVVGQSLVQMAGVGPYSVAAILPLIGAILIRNGIAPAHCWMTHLFEHGTLGTALLFVTPMAGAYAAVRLLLPIAPNWALTVIGIMGLLTAVYSAGMALVQTQARRFICFLLLSNSALVIVGLEMVLPVAATTGHIAHHVPAVGLEAVTPIGLTGALCVWLSVGLSLGGFGLTLRALESRLGGLELTEFRGLYEHVPSLAICFLLTGLASVGFPGTLGFVGTELLVDAAVEGYPYVGVAVVLAAALNGIAIIKAYFVLFTGGRHVSSVSLKTGLQERFAVLSLTALIIGGGLFPHWNVASRHRAASELMAKRVQNLGEYSGLPGERASSSPVESKQGGPSPQSKD